MAPFDTVFMTTFFLVLGVWAQSENSLRLVQIFFRHGQRAPTTFITFPTDPPDLAKDFPYEKGEMTKRGMQQEFNLGENLREYYGKLMKNRYRASDLRVWSGIDNRTVASALLTLAGLFPPEKDQIWNPALHWIPIPVQTEPIIDEVSFGLFDHCALLRMTIEGSTAYHDLVDKYRSQVEFLQNKTGIVIENAYIFQKVLDGIKTRDGLPDILPLPSWANNEKFMERVIKLHNALHGSFIDIFLTSIGAWHHDQIVARFDEALHKTTKHKMILYSTHDTNMMTLGRLYNLSYVKDNLPDFASYLAFELHQIDNETFVQIYFHPNLNGSRIEIGIPACPSPCMFDQFAKLSSRMTSREWEIECSGSDIDDRCTLYGSIAGALVIFIILILGALFSALWSCLAYRSKYHQLNDPERHKLLN